MNEKFNLNQLIMVVVAGSVFSNLVELITLLPLLNEIVYRGTEAVNVLA